MISLKALDDQNIDLLHRIYPGNEGMYWVNFNWYWSDLSKIRPKVRTELLYIDQLDRPIGVVAYGQHYIDRQLTIEAPDEYELYHMVIDHHVQGHGLGRASTLTVLDKMANMTGCKKLRVACHPDNKAATKLYLSLGFIKDSVNYDDDPLYYLEPKNLPSCQSFDKEIVAPNGGQPNALSWSEESRSSQKTFSWKNWELGLET